MMRVSIFFLLLTAAFNSMAQRASDLLPEQIVVHTDKNFYISGQVIWFKTYVLAADYSRMQELSKTAYAELLNPQGIPVSQVKIRLQEGLGSGSVALAETAASGTYVLRVYTNWMKNDPASVRSKAITVINTNEVFDTTSFHVLDMVPDSLREAASSAVADDIAGTMKQTKLTISTDRKIYQQRNPVTLTLTGDEQVAQLANVSVAVFRLNQLTERDQSKWLQPTIAPGGDFIDQGQQVLPELNGFTMAVSVKDQSGRPLADIPVIASVSGRLADAQFAQSDQDGMAYFNFKGVYGHHELLLKTTPEFQNTVELRALSPFLQSAHPALAGKSAILYRYLPVLEEMHNHHVVQKAFEHAGTVKFLPENLDSLSFYGKPYATYLLDNYKRFVTMEEVLREYVREVSVRIRNKNYYIPVFNRQNYDLRKYVDINSMIDEYPALILIDGIPVTANQLMKYDPLKVRKLEVMADRYAMGKMLYDGILSFTTYEGNYPGLELDPSDLLTDMDGWQYTRIFQMPDYNDLQRKNSRMPDFRELLYWNPQTAVAPGKPSTLSFFTGDITGEFLIDVHGITTDGRLVQARSTFQVIK